MLLLLLILNRIVYCGRCRSWRRRCISFGDGFQALKIRSGWSTVRNRCGNQWSDNSIFVGSHHDLLHHWWLWRSSSRHQVLCGRLGRCTLRDQTGPWALRVWREGAGSGGGGCAWDRRGSSGVFEACLMIFGKSWTGWRREHATTHRGPSARTHGARKRGSTNWTRDGCTQGSAAARGGFRPLCMAKLVPDTFIAACANIVLKRVHDVAHQLRIFLLLRLGDTHRLQHSLPFLRKTLDTRHQYWHMCREDRLQLI